MTIYLRFSALVVGGLFVSIIVQFWSNLINIDVPMNISHQRSRHLFIITEYFIDQEKYFYLILFHMYVAFFIGTTVMVAIGTMLITYAQHTCGTFRIGSYRIEHAMSVDILQNITLKNKILMTEGIIYAVDIHRQAVKFLFTSTILVQYLRLIISFCIGRLSQDLLYNVQWYRAPIHIQKMILFLLQRETKEFTLIALDEFPDCNMMCLQTYRVIHDATLQLRCWYALFILIIILSNKCVEKLIPKIFQITSSGNNVEKLLFSFIFLFAAVTYMFIANYIGQNVTDHNNHVLSAAYNVQWYRALIHIQKMILFLLQRQTKEFTLSVDKLFHASIECFATVR
ncbi:uncharacterized protein LOC143898549 [Temnothorax americanus]|uniref:uncharacterized protein LOC143898549 n=1 Tax=Temnothorax americanus TaxID=1964332 RepID=UPI004067CAF6